MYSAWYLFFNKKEFIVAYNYIFHKISAYPFHWHKIPVQLIIYSKALIVLVFEVLLPSIELSKHLEI